MIGHVLLTLAAHAADGAITGEARAIGTAQSSFPLDAEGTTAGWGPALDTRLRVRAAGATGALRGVAETDLFTGLLVGDTWALDPLDRRGRDDRDALTLAGVSPRRLAVGYRFPWADAEVGLQTSQWGLGLVANDGTQSPWFGRTDFGDRALRARVATAPIQRGEVPLYVIAAGDRIVEDEFARWSAGDAAYQGVLALLYADGGLDAEVVRRVGVYSAWRSQRLADGDALRAWVSDAYADWTVPVGPLALQLSAEGAMIRGTTDAARTYQAPAGVQVRSGGAVAQVAVSAPDQRWTAALRGAWASGDGSLDDGRVNDFRFDPDCAMGAVLFDEVLSQVDLRAYAQVADPSQAAAPPDGAETLAGDGALHAATAVQPMVSVRPTRLVGLRLGALAAWSTQPIAQPYETFRAGGVPTNLAGVPTEGRWLGAELDWAVAFDDPAAASPRLRPSLEVQGGHAFPAATLGVGPRVDQLLVVGRLTR